MLLVGRRKNEEYFTAQEIPFNGYIERKLNELKEKQLIENQRLREESLKNEQTQQKKDAKKQRKEANRAARKEQEVNTEQQQQQQSSRISTRSQNATLNSGIDIIPTKI